MNVRCEGTIVLYHRNSIRGNTVGVFHDATPTLHAYSNNDGDDYRITIFKQDGYYYAYVVENYGYGGFKKSYVLKNEDYLGLLEDLNQKIYS